MIFLPLLCDFFQLLLHYLNFCLHEHLFCLFFTILDLFLFLVFYWFLYRRITCLRKSGGTKCFVCIFLGVQYTRHYRSYVHFTSVYCCLLINCITVGNTVILLSSAISFADQLLLLSSSSSTLLYNFWSVLSLAHAFTSCKLPFQLFIFLATFVACFFFPLISPFLVTLKFIQALDRFYLILINILLSYGRLSIRFSALCQSIIRRLILFIWHLSVL